MEDSDDLIRRILRRDGWTCSPSQLMDLAYSRTLADRAFLGPEGHTPTRSESTRERTREGLPQGNRIIWTTWVTPVPLRDWLPADRDRHLLIPDSEIPNLLMTRLPLRMGRNDWNNSLQELRRVLLERYFLMFETGVGDTGVWISFVGQGNGELGRFHITGQGDLWGLAQIIELDVGILPSEFVIERSVASPCRDRKSLDFDQEGEIDQEEEVAPLEVEVEPADSDESAPFDPPWEVHSDSDESLSVNDDRSDDETIISITSL